MARAIKKYLRIEDVKSLVQAHGQVEAVIRALRTTNWAGAGTAIAALAPLDQWIVDLYNRVESDWLSYLQGLRQPITEWPASEAHDQAAAASSPSTDQAEPRE